MNLVIIDYGSGNLRSVQNAFKYCIRTNNIKCSIKVTRTLENIEKADHFILPGVGSFADCKKGLEQTEGLVDLLTNEVINRKKKFLGICVGMQLMVSYSLEKKRTSGFNWLNGGMKKINIEGLDYLGRNYKIPHMGWNNLTLEKKNHPIFENITEKDQYYFVHSYGLESKDKDEILAHTTYCRKIPAIIGRDNYIGVQFHPEKSGISGQKFIYNWLRWSP